MGTIPCVITVKAMSVGSGYRCGKCSSLSAEVGRSVGCFLCLVKCKEVEEKREENK